MDTVRTGSPQNEPNTGPDEGGDGCQCNDLRGGKCLCARLNCTRAKAKLQGKQPSTRGRRRPATGGKGQERRPWPFNQSELDLLQFRFQTSNLRHTRRGDLLHAEICHRGSHVFSTRSSGFALGSKARAWFSVFDAVKARASDAGIRRVTDFCLTGSDRQSEGPGGFAVGLHTKFSVQKQQIDGAAMPK